ncbi:hypothetical protein D3C72_1934720 [compost metagenome]|jgi:hypothetical protein
MSSGLADEPQELDEQPPDVAFASKASMEDAGARLSSEIMAADIGCSIASG